MDLISLATLAFFGSLLASVLLGFVIGWLSAFELGLGVGLIVPGAVSLAFATMCLREYRDFSTAGPNTVPGEVIAIEDHAVNEAGTITQEVPVVRFTAAGGVEHTVRGPRASGLKPGASVTVVYDPADPGRARVGQVSQLRGCAIAFMLFGTFPSSVGAWFVHSYVDGRRRRGRGRDELEQLDEELRRPRRRTKLLEPLTIFFNLILVGGIFWTGLGPGELPDSLTVGFGLVSAGLWGHGIRGLFDPEASASWCFGILVLALNFSVWVVALWLLLPSEW